MPIETIEPLPPVPLESIPTIRESTCKWCQSWYKTGTQLVLISWAELGHQNEGDASIDKLGKAAINFSYRFQFKTAFRRQFTLPENWLLSLRDALF
jgi:hypothetical protein